MKYRRRPVERDVVDALKGQNAYHVLHADGSIREMPHEAFDELYELVKRERIAKPRRAKKEKGAPT